MTDMWLWSRKVESLLRGPDKDSW